MQGRVERGAGCGQSYSGCSREGGWPADPQRESSTGRARLWGAMGQAANGTGAEIRGQEGGSWGPESFSVWAGRPLQLPC